MAIYNLAVVDTSPGGPHPLAPPQGWSGDDQAYRQLMRQRYKDPRWGSDLLVAARYYRNGLVRAYHGPWAHEAQQILKALK